MPKLIPPDPKQCQAQLSNGNTFMTFGGVSELVRCENVPLVVVKELRKGKDGKRGSMSLCAGCLLNATKRFGGGYFRTGPFKRKEPQ